MIDQTNYIKYLNAFNMLKHQHTDREEATALMFGRVLGKKIWEDKDVDLLISQRRPVQTYNFLLPIALHLAGSQIQSRSSLKAVPFKDATVKGANGLTNLMFWNYDKTYFEYEFTRNFMATIIASLGWMRNYWSFDKGHWIAKNVDPFRIRWDIMATERDFSDCRFLQDTTWGSAEEVIGMAGDEATRDEIMNRIRFYEPKINQHAWFEKIQEGAFDWSPHSTQSDRDDYVDLKMGRYRLVDHHEKRDIPVAVLVDDETGAYEVVTEFPKEKIDAMISDNPRFGLERFNVSENWHGIICPGIEMVVAEERYEVETADNDFMIMPTFCYDLHPKLNEGIGVFDNLYQIVQSINKRKATMLEYIMTVTGGDWIATDEAVQDHEEDWSTPGFRYLRKYKAGAQKPERDRPPTLPEGVWRYEQEELNFLELISSLPKNVRGFKDTPNESGTLFASRVQQGEIQLAYLMNNTTFAQKRLASACIANIQAYMTKEEQIYLTDYNTGQEMYMDVEGDMVDGTYNIAIDATKPSISARQLTFIQGMEIGRIMPQELVRWDLIVKDSDIAHGAEWAAYIRMILKLKYGIDVDNLDNTDPVKLAMTQMGGGENVSQTADSLLNRSSQQLKLPV